MYICTFVYVYMCICVYVYMCICVYVYMCICVYVYMCICICIPPLNFKIDTQNDAIFEAGDTFSRVYTSIYLGCISGPGLRQTFLFELGRPFSNVHPHGGSPGLPGLKTRRHLR